MSVDGEVASRKWLAPRVGDEDGDCGTRLASGIQLLRSGDRAGSSIGRRCFLEISAVITENEKIV